jgi:hypothetical protein
MSITQPLNDQLYVPYGAEVLGQPKDATQKWAMRKTLAFVVMASSILWSIIIYAAIYAAHQLL